MSLKKKKPSILTQEISLLVQSNPSVQDTLCTTSLTNVPILRNHLRIIIHHVTGDYFALFSFDLWIILLNANNSVSHPPQGRQSRGTINLWRTLSARVCIRSPRLTKHLYHRRGRCRLYIMHT